MYIVEDRNGAVGAMVLSLVLLGSWPACFTWAEKRGRLFSHTYLDYSISFLAMAVGCALTLGQLGPSREDQPNFLDQLTQHNWPLVLCAVMGGTLLMLGNLSMQYGVALTGLAICLPVQASMTVIIGSTINYFLDGQLNDAALLFPGVLCFLVAIVLGSFAHVENSKAMFAKHGRTPSFDSLHAEKHREAMCIGGDEWETLMDAPQKDVEVGKAGDSCDWESIRLGLTLTVSGGLCFGFFSPAFNLATNDQLHLLEPGVPPLTVYAAYFYFSCAFFIMAVVINITFLYYPPFGGTVSSLKSWAADWEGRGVALLAGVLAGMGNALQFVGGEAAGFAAADMVQAFPLVSTIWGVVLFREFRGTSWKAKALLAGMYAMYILAVALLAASAKPRRHPPHP